MEELGQLSDAANADRARQEAEKRAVEERRREERKKREEEEETRRREENAMARRQDEVEDMEEDSEDLPFGGNLPRNHHDAMTKFLKKVCWRPKRRRLERQLR